MFKLSVRAYRAVTAVGIKSGRRVFLGMKAAGGVRGMTSRTPRDRNIANTDKLRDRALWCRRLAMGAADPLFAARLKMISEEYERTSLEQDREANAPDE